MTELLPMIILGLLTLSFAAYYFYRQFYVRTREYEFDQPLEGVVMMRLVIHHDDVHQFYVLFDDGKLGEVQANEVKPKEK